MYNNERFYLMLRDIIELSPTLEDLESRLNKYELSQVTKLEALESWKEKRLAEVAENYKQAK